MGLPTLALTQAPASLRGFGGEAVLVLGQVQLMVAFGMEENRREKQILFDVVDIPYSYNAIFGCATLNKFEAVSHHNYLKLKMPSLTGMIVVKGAIHNVEAKPHDRARHTPKPTPHGKVIKVKVDDADPTRFVSLGGDMGEREAENILEVLKKNIDIFAWSPDEVGGVSTDLIMHHLAVKPEAKPSKQKLRKMSADRQEAAKAEVQKLLKAGVIQEIDHPEWLANPVLVRKLNGKWRMCVDFTDLNKVCPKDNFPLPRIDQLVDSTAGCELMSFLDAYSSYHQIHMNPADIPKTAFITPFSTFCHLRMPFDLRNAGATFTRLVYKVLYKQLGRNVEAYVHDIVVKSRKAFDHASDLQETFDNLRAAGVKLNPENAIKSQVLVDFVAEWTPAFSPEPEPVEQPWVMYSDGSWSHKGAGAAAVLTLPRGVPIWYAARLQFDTTNNTIEYEAVLLGLRKAKELGVRRLLIRTDSKLVASHVDKSFETKEEGMKRYLEAVRSMEKCFAGITVEHLPRGQNEEADTLAKSAACGGPHSPSIFFEVLYAPSVPTESLDIMAIDQAELGEDPEDWRTPFVKYLKNGWLPEDEAEAKRLQLRATKYKLVSSQLYRSRVLQPLLHCISFAEAEEMAKEIHQGLCGAHQAARTVASKVFCQGVYWPTVLKVCVEQAKKWGLDIIGPSPVARNGYKFAIMAIEYFSRCIEAEPLSAIISVAVQKFVWKNIVCRFGVPKEFIADNGKQFDSDKFREMCEGLNLEIRFASVAHPQSNGASKRSDGKILEALKKRLEGAAKGKRPDEMLSVLCALQTTPTRPTKFSPFMLLYGDEAMTPTELGANSPRVIFSGGEDGREVSLELLERVRVEALEHMRKYATSTSATYNKKVRPTELLPGHLVLRKKANPVAVGKLELKWEGPYLIKYRSRTGSFHLATLEGEEFNHSWNAASLKRFYV
uniref:OSJNBa0073L13.2 protein n=1 Tax=Oryza sativa subsp. japonica TaxID=39947 RepID=Q7FAH7_ORYSJ|nr:OSJNBa0073L13.2 [Oryza sativa Japonica Group]